MPVYCAVHWKVWNLGHGAAWRNRALRLGELRAGRPRIVLGGIPNNNFRKNSFSTVATVCMLQSAWNPPARRPAGCLSHTG